MAEDVPRERPLWFDHPVAWDHIRAALAAANFTDRGVGEALGIDQARAISAQDVPVLLHRTRRGTPLETLIRLFLIGVAVDCDTLRRAIAPATVEEWLEAGLIRLDGEAAAAEFQVLPFRDLVIAFDWPQRLRSPEAAEYVMGVAGSSLTLASGTIRRHAGLSLDLGTGCGILAFLAAAHSDRVIATDRNPRAVTIARFNARLNDLANVECREGDLFEPVAGCEFDLVVTNPPFVISPERRYVYRDSGMQGDDITQTIVRRVPGLLREGGYCQILCNWAHLAGQDWRERLAGWFTGTGCDAWVMPSETQDADVYAAKWIRHTERAEGERFDQRFSEWVAYYAQAGIEAVSFGLITMRRRGGRANWYCTEDGPGKLLGPAGETIARIFEARGLIESLPDEEALLEQRLVLSPGVAWQQRLRPSAERWEMAESTLLLERGLGYSGNVDPYVASLLLQCDGQRRLGDLIAELAQSLDQEPSRLAPACLEVVRRLIERGFLAPVTGSAPQPRP